MAPCISKVLEMMIKNRLEWYAENRKILGEHQWGFRKAKGIGECQYLLTSTVYKAFSSHKTIACCFLDLSSAYDIVDLPDVKAILIKHKLPRNLIEVVMDLLTNRQLYICLPKSDQLVGPHTANMGLPQGSLLTPLLFNLYTTLPEDITIGKCKILQFADDFCILSENNNIRTCIENLNITTDNVVRVLQERNLELNPSKSTAMRFTKRGTTRQPADIRINDKRIPWVTSYKYLGLVINQNMSWEGQVSNLCDKANKGIGVMKAMCGTWWGATLTSYSPFTNH